MNKIIGYIVSALGVVSLLLWAISAFRGAVEGIINLQLSTIIYLITGLILTALGIFLIIKNPFGGKKLREVPIYQGREIVGYRRN